MSETRVKRKPNDVHENDGIFKTFRWKTNQHESEFNECGGSKGDHSNEPLMNESNQSESSTKTLPTEAFGELDCVGDEKKYLEWDKASNNIRQIRLSCDTDANEILELLRHRPSSDIDTPGVIFSILCDSDFDDDEAQGMEIMERKRHESIQHIRELMCRYFVNAAASTNALMITGGLNKDVDHLIGNDVKHRLVNGERLPRAVLGICNWGWLEKQKALRNDSCDSNKAHGSNPTGLSLNPNHSHFLLVDDGTQEKSGCELILREKVESALIKWNSEIEECSIPQEKELNTNHEEKNSDLQRPRSRAGEQLCCWDTCHGDGALTSGDGAHTPAAPALDTGLRIKDSTNTASTPNDGHSEPQHSTANTFDTHEIPLVYILIGGGVNALSSVQRALANRHPVIIAKGTGGAADVISGAANPKDGLTLEHFPEIFGTIFEQLAEFLTAGGTHENKVRHRIANLTANTRIEPFLEIVDLLDKATDLEGGVQQFRNDIATMQKKDTNELLAEIKALLISNCYSAIHSETDTVDRMRVIIEQMLVVNAIPKENAKQALDGLDLNALNDVLTKIKHVYADLKALRKHDQLMIFNIKCRQRETIILEALKKVKWTNPSVLYTLLADWDSEQFFKQLQLENWKRINDEDLFRKLFNNKKYVKLMMEHVGNCDWLTKPEGPLDQDFKTKGYEMCGRLQEKLCKSGSDTYTNDERLRINAKLLFVWCVKKNLPEAAMLFWKQGQDCLTMALVAYHESKKQKENTGHKARDEEIRRQKQFFAGLALGFLKKCHWDNSCRTRTLLLLKTEDLGGCKMSKPFYLAIEAKFREFISDDAFDDLLGKIWSDGIDKYDKYKYVPAMLSLACPFLAPALLEIPANKDRHQDLNKSCKIRLSGCVKDVTNYCWKVRKFVNTSFATFYYSFIFYIAYLTLFSVVMLTDFRAKISPSEIVLSIWTSILLIEEVRQFFVENCKYWRNPWNYFDNGTLSLYIIGFTLRVVCHGDPTMYPIFLYVARIVLAFSLLIGFLRTLQYLSIYESLGPKIYMMHGLVADLVGFLLILGVFIAAYGVVSNVILYPNQPLSATLLKDVFYDAWWSVIQQFNMDALGSNCNKNNVSATITAEYCSNPSDENIDYVLCKENQCPANNWIVSVLLAFYALVTCIMLLNVLIAMFNSTFVAIENRQEEVSRVQRCRLIDEYRSRTMIPPPLCVITYPYHITMALRRCWHEPRPPKNDVENGQITEAPGSSRRSTEDDDKCVNAMVKNWECSMAAAYYKENTGKDGWPASRMMTDNFDEVPLSRHTIRKILKKVNEINEQFNEDTDEEIR